MRDLVNYRLFITHSQTFLIVKYQYLLGNYHYGKNIILKVHQGKIFLMHNFKREIIRIQVTQKNVI